MAAIVERDGAAAGTRQRRHPAGLDPVDLLSGGKAVNEDDRFTLALVHIRDIDGPVPEARHEGCNLYEKGRDVTRDQPRAQTPRPGGPPEPCGGESRATSCAPPHA